MAEREAIIDFCNALEAACVNLRIKLGDKSLEKPVGPTVATVNESVFAQLKWDPQHSDKMGDYDVAGSANNVAYKFTEAHKILESSSATIKTRYHGQTYTYAYWIYGENKIYRQRLKEAQR